MMTEHQYVKFLRSCLFFWHGVSLCVLTGSVPAGRVRFLEVCEERNAERSSGGSQSQQQPFLRGNVSVPGVGLVALGVGLFKFDYGKVDKLAPGAAARWSIRSSMARGHFLSWLCRCFIHVKFHNVPISWYMYFCVTSYAKSHDLYVWYSEDRVILILFLLSITVCRRTSSQHTAIIFLPGCFIIWKVLTEYPNWLTGIVLV